MFKNFIGTLKKWWFIVVLRENLLAGGNFLRSYPNGSLQPRKSMLFFLLAGDKALVWRCFSPRVTKRPSAGRYSDYEMFEVCWCHKF
jgi:hypothetical protein